MDTDEKLLSRYRQLCGELAFSQFPGDTAAVQLAKECAEWHLTEQGTRALERAAAAVTYKPPEEPGGFGKVMCRGRVLSNRVLQEEAAEALMAWRTFAIDLADHVLGPTGNGTVRNVLGRITYILCDAIVEIREPGLSTQQQLDRCWRCLDRIRHALPDYYHQCTEKVIKEEPIDVPTTDLLPDMKILELLEAGYNNLTHSDLRADFFTDAAMDQRSKGMQQLMEGLDKYRNLLGM